jgi:hypothetical protein
MNKARHLAPALGALAAALVAVACQDAASPPPSPGSITAAVKPPKDDCANFRLTGGGRTDDRSHVTANKSTPESHDFATFGFQARPNGCPGIEGSGQLEWNEHDPNAFGGGFAFHGRVTFFTTTHDETFGDPRCGRFGGFGRVHARDGSVVDGVAFEVQHACDIAEPGRGNDHISIAIGDAYSRHGLLSGGNIQWHRLTGNN